MFHSGLRKMAPILTYFKHIESSKEKEFKIILPQPDGLWHVYKCHASSTIEITNSISYVKFLPMALSMKTLPCDS